MFDYHRVYLWYIPRNHGWTPFPPYISNGSNGAAWLPHGRVITRPPRGMDEFAMGTGPPPAANIQQQLQDQVQRLGVIFWAGWGMVLFFGPEMVVKNVVTWKFTWWHWHFLGCHFGLEDEFPLYRWGDFQGGLHRIGFILIMIKSSNWCPIFFVGSVGSWMIRPTRDYSDYWTIVSWNSVTFLSYLPFIINAHVICFFFSGGSQS